MTKRLIVTAAAAFAMLSVAAPAQAGPGADIKEACGASFGALVSSARSTGTAAHVGYAGGAAAFATPAILAAHGCAA